MLPRCLQGLWSLRHFSVPRETVECAVLQQVSTIPKLSTQRVTAVSTFKALGLDSLDTVEIVTALEEKLGVALGDAEVKKLSSLKEMTDAFCAKLDHKN